MSVVGDVLCLFICVSVGGCVVSVYPWGEVLWGSVCVYQCRSRGSPEAGVTTGWEAPDMGVGN